MAYTIETLTSNSIKITTGGTYTLALVPKKITPYVHTEVVIEDLAIDPVIAYTNNKYTLAISTEYAITFATEGVYFLYITENAVDTLHVFIQQEVIDEYFDTFFSTLITGTPEVDCKFGTKYAEYHDFGVLSLLAMTFYGESNTVINTDYDGMTTIQANWFDYVADSIYRFDMYITNNTLL